MKNLCLNISILIAAAIFSSLGLFVQDIAAQKTASVNTAVKRKNPTGNPTVKPAPAIEQFPVTAETRQIIVASTSARIRKEPNLAAETVQTARIGAIYPLIEQNADWCRIRLGKASDEASGWIAKKLTQSFVEEKRGEVYRSVADKYLKQSSPAFADMTQLADFLTAAQKEFKDANNQAYFAWRRLVAMKAALDSIPFERQTQNPYKEYLEKQADEIVYSDPSGKWLVRSELFWTLRDKYKSSPVAEEIAWSAAQNPIPGECEGYINCYLYQMRATDAEYLNFYPNGKYSRQALRNLTDSLEPIAADTGENAVYAPATDTSDRADFYRYLTELRAIVSKTPHLEKSKTLAQIKRIAETGK